MRRLSIGINWQGEFDIDKLVEQAKVADDAGVEACFVAEAWGRDAFTILTVLARETRNIKLGTSIVNIFSRSPAALAQHFATLDELSGGRMIIGLGTSGHRVIEHFHGVPFQRPLTRLREYVEIINTLMRGERLEYDGTIFKLERGFTLRFEPVRSHIPIWLASVTPRSVELCAQIADGWFPIFMPRERWKSQLGAFFDAVRAAGRDPEDVIVRNPSQVTVTDEPERALAATAGTAAFYIARMGDFYYEHFVRMGYQAEADAVRDAWKEGGSSAGMRALPPALVSQMGTAGSVEECADALDEAEGAGFKMHSISVAERDPHKRGQILRRLVD
ncbi:MAG: LLM class flavin-dependent oxidoreductase [Myxococcota bacterium]